MRDQKMKKNKISTTVLFLTVLLLSGLIISISLLPLNDRFAPLEPDDSYTRIAKSVQMRDCFFQDCPAKKTLEQQFEMQRSEPRSAQFIHDAYARIFQVYSPLFSLSMLTIESLGFSQEQSHNFLLSVGGILFFASCAYWLTPLIGPAATALTLILLIGLQLPGYGITEFTPNNISLAIAMWSWGLIIRTKGACAPQLIVAIILSCYMHITGKAWMIVSLLLYFSYLFPDIDRNRLRQGLLATLVLLVVMVLIPWAVSEPTLVMPEINNGTSQGLLKIFQSNLPAVFPIVGNWLKHFDSAFQAIMLILAGLFLILKENQTGRKAYIVVFFGISLLLFLSLFVYYPYNELGGVAFSRIWTPFVILLTATTAAGLFHLILTLKRLTLSYFAHGEEKDVNEGRLLWLTALLAFTLLLSDHLANNLYVFFRDYNQSVRHKVDRLQHFLDPGQLQTLHQDAQHGSPLKILYNDIESANFFFSYGGLQYDALYMPPIITNPHPETWIGADQGVTNFVMQNPNIPKHRGFLIGSDDRFGGSLQLGLQFSSQTKQPQTLSILLANLSTSEATIILAVPDHEGEGGYQEMKKAVPPNWTGWWHVDGLTWQMQEMMVLKSFDPQQKIYLMGTRIGQQTHPTWPWDQPVSIIHPLATKSEKAGLYQFDSQKLWVYDDRHFDIANDSGNLILLKF